MGSDSAYRKFRNIPLMSDMTTDVIVILGHSSRKHTGSTEENMVVSIGNIDRQLDASGDRTLDQRAESNNHGSLWVQGTNTVDR